MKGMKGILAIRKTTRRLLKNLRSESDDPFAPTESDHTKDVLTNETFNQVLDSLEGEDAKTFLTTLWESMGKFRAKEPILIDKMKQMGEQVEEQSKMLEETLNKVKEQKKEIKQNQEEIFGLKKQIDSAHAREQNSQETIEIARADIHKLKKEIEAKEAELEELVLGLGISGKIDTSVKDKKKMVVELSALRESLQETTELAANYKKDIERMEETIKEMEVQNIINKAEVNKLKKSKTVVDKEIVHYKNTLKTKTEQITALQKLVDSQRDKIKEVEKTVKTKKLEMEKLSETIGNLNTKVEQKDEEMNVLNEKLEHLQLKNEKINKLFKVQELEVLKLQKEVSKTSLVQHICAKKVISAEKEKEKVEHELGEAKLETKETGKVLDEREKELGKDKKLIQSLQREKLLMNKKILQISETAKEHFLKYQEEIIARQGLQTENEKLMEETVKLNGIIKLSKSDQERLNSEKKKLLEKLEQQIELTKFKESEVLENKRIAKEAETKMYQTAEIFEILKDERDDLAYKLSTSKDALEDSTSKMKLVNREIEQLKEDLSNREKQLLKIELVLRKKNDEKESVSLELGRTVDKLEETKKNLTIALLVRDKLNILLDKTSNLNSALGKQLLKMQTTSSQIGTQLNRKISELTLVYEKLDIMAAILRKGEEHYQQRLDDIRILKLEVKKLRDEKALLVKSFDNMADLRKEIYHLTRELVQEKQKCKALEEEIETPINYHRWRILEGNDPDKRELLDKIVFLRKRSVVLITQNAFLRKQVEDLIYIHQSTKQTMARLPGPDAAEALYQARITIKDKEAELRTMASELAACEEQHQLEVMQSKMARRELNDLKKKYYELKVKQDRARSKRLAERFTIKRNKGIDAPSAVGGGFSMSQILPRVIR